MLVCENAEEG
jgi:hypothetical protein